MDKEIFLEQLHSFSPRFVKALRLNEKEADVRDILPPTPEVEIEQIEMEIGQKLPESYKDFLRCTRGFVAFDGDLSFGTQHPFYHRFHHKFPELKTPPKSDGMLCFGEFYWESIGDQLLFDVSVESVDGELPIYYYSLFDRPPDVRPIASDVIDFLDRCLDFEGFL